jgi:hypothetical protein
LLDRLVLRRTVTVKRLGGGEADEKAFWRFLHNERVSERALIEAARSHLLAQVAGRRVLAIQDTSEINFSRQKRRKAAFGRGGNGTDPASSSIGAGGRCRYGCCSGVGRCAALGEP